MLYLIIHLPILKVGATWTGAKPRNGKLVEIESVEEQNAIFSAIASAGLNAGIQFGMEGEYLWIARYCVEGSWVWDGDNDLSTVTAGTAIANSYERGTTALTG